MSQPTVFPLSNAFDPRELQVYAALGAGTFRALVEAFYRRVAADPVLAPMFPTDLTDAKERQFLFLIQFFGGPRTYLERYGHPRLRMRHLPFVIGMEERNAWLAHMVEAIEEVDIPEPWGGIMRRYFERTSLAMMNQEPEGR